MHTRISTCSHCGEQDYSDYMARIDNGLLCQVCWDDEMDRAEDEEIRISQTEPDEGRNQK